MAVLLECELQKMEPDNTIWEGKVKLTVSNKQNCHYQEGQASLPVLFWTARKLRSWCLTARY